MSRTNDLGQDRISRLVIRLAIPTMLAQLVNVLYSIVDRMYIGTGVGSLALAGVGVCAPIVTLLTSLVPWSVRVVLLSWPCRWEAVTIKVQSRP